MIANYTKEANHYGKFNNQIAKYLNVTLLFENENTFELIIKDQNRTSYEIPYKKPFPHKSLLNFNTNNFSEDLLSYKVDIKEEPFSIRVTRKSTDEIIFDMNEKNLIVSKQYLEIGTSIPTQYLFGMGERNFQYRLKPGIYTLWARDEVGDVETGEPPGHNSYGVHPMYLMKEKSGLFHTTYLRTSNPFDFIVGEESVNYKIAGGIIHFKFFLGDAYPETAIKFYHDYIEGFTIPPFWAFGFHQSRWGYRSARDLRESVEGYKRNNIPIEAIWMDIDYMEDFIPFSSDTIKFSPIKLKKLKAEFSVKLICIIDPAIPSKKSDQLKELLAQKSFVRDVQGNAFLGRLYSGESLFPDFFHPNIGTFWSKMFLKLHENVPFDGIWLDMNEPTSFCDGACYDYMFNQITDAQDLEALSYAFEIRNLPYVPGNRSLETKTLAINAIHHPFRIELDVHSLYGTLETFETYKVLKEKFGYSLPFILTRNTFPGSGKYGAHWTGDNLANWEFLKLSIPSVFNFNMFGIPMIGDDICGFFGNTTESLCGRWIQLSSLYPFARNHNHKEFDDHQFHTMGPMIASLARKALKFRYSILKYYYSLFLEKKDKGMIIKPLFYEYISEQLLFDDQIMNSQFLIGNDLMVAPILEQKKNFSLPYFPMDRWYDIHSGREFTDLDAHNFYGIVHSSFDDLAPIFAKQGTIILFQNVENVSNTLDLGNDYTFHAFLKKIETEGADYTAFGRMIDIENLNDEKDVEYFCLNHTNGCLLDINLSISLEEDEGTKIIIKFTKKNPEDSSFSQNNSFSKLILSSLNLQKMTLDISKTYTHFSILKRGNLEKKLLADQIISIHPEEKIQLIFEFEPIQITNGIEIVIDIKLDLDESDDISKFNWFDQLSTLYSKVITSLYILYILLRIVKPFI